MGKNKKKRNVSQFKLLIILLITIFTAQSVKSPEDADSMKEQIETKMEK